MTNTIKGTAPMRCELTWTGSDHDLVEMIDEMSGRSLDSVDLGDAMGWIIRQCMTSDTLEIGVQDERGTLNAEIIFDLFEWEGIEGR